MTTLEDLDRKLDLILAALPGQPAMKATAETDYAPAAWENDELTKALQSDGYRAENISNSNLTEMLVAVKGDQAKAKALFVDSVRRHGWKYGLADLAAQGKNSPTDAEVAYWASYHVWVKWHDQGTGAVSVAQGLEDPLNALDGQ